MSRDERLGILGGTFDPLHLGHLRAAESVREAMSLDRIVFIPSRTPPHKMRPGIAPAEDRYRMVLRALENEPAFTVSSVEVERQGPSYTIDTLSALAKRHAGTEIFFITGIDSFVISRHGVDGKSYCDPTRSSYMTGREAISRRPTTRCPSRCTPFL